MEGIPAGGALPSASWVFGSLHGVFLFLSSWCVGRRLSVTCAAADGFCLSVRVREFGGVFLGWPGGRELAPSSEGIRAGPPADTPPPTERAHARPHQPPACAACT